MRDEILGVFQSVRLVRGDSAPPKREKVAGGDCRLGTKRCFLFLSLSALLTPNLSR